MTRKCLALVLAVTAFMSVPTIASAWNYTGHRVIASIACRKSDEPTKQRLAAILR